MLKKHREKISQALYLAFYPWGVDKDFDEQSSKSFLRFLDIIYFVGLALIFSVPLMSLTILVIQKHGS